MFSLVIEFEGQAVNFEFGQLPLEFWHLDGKGIEIHASKFLAFNEFGRC